MADRARMVISRNSQGSESATSVAARNNRSHARPRRPATPPAIAAGSWLETPRPAQVAATHEFRKADGINGPFPARPSPVRIGGKEER